MKKKDYYLILGVSRSESAEGIKAAFRKLAKEYHPDKTGPEGTRRFQELAEAYEVLSDPGARKEYTEQLRSAEKRRKSRKVTKAGGLRNDPFSELRKSNRYSSLSEVLLDALCAGDPFSTRPRRHSAVDLELVLSPEEARRGGVISAQIPVRSVCPACEGTGGLFFVCPACEGAGIVDKTASFRIGVPPEARHGMLLEAHVGPPSNPVLLRIRVLIQ